ncbi:BatA domain-containing protein [Lysobacter sp. Root690]|uniref:BatA domain-containing protein n=1 Tax=Lysobacter sp. Root690 TaxID=1736588 RepID=UPI0007021255|nr:BatA domain-containing protein [Lysobacter sp. Root690]KRB04146.1 hypothetical protein ASD86_17555 [Lysobacter sp. Root690]
MNSILLLPIGLVALAALIVPLLIHLARRSEQRPTDFAALRWLRQRPTPRHRIRFDEWLLLAVRLLLLALLALLLARPALYGAQSEAPWIAVVPGVQAQAVAALERTADARVRWLAPGFPEFHPAAPVPPTSSELPVSSLLRELDATLPAQVVVTVLVPEQLQGADAQRPRLSRQVEWRVLPGAMPARNAQAIAVPDPSIRYAADRAAALPYLRAAIASWREPGAVAAGRVNGSIALDTQPLDASSRQLMWLKPGPLPDAVSEWIANGGTVLLDAASAWPSGEGAGESKAIVPVPLWRNADGAVLVEGARYGRGKVMRWTRALTPQALPELLESGFAGHLRNLFEPPREPPSRVMAREHVPSTGAAAFALPPRDLRLWLALLIALVFLVERWLATRPRRGAAP